ncbi:MAG: hypothetical protein IKG82_11365, partial [Oscillospiraceae bacterium]|nr:hypothetical protein [Oscillospiraceae bacterium]MBR3419279.1 hypothetical protein [Oscillospiraceae bacterium]
MQLYFQDEEKIYFSKTRNYFQEVLSSYSIGNYRSAVVMLYSVAICDLLLKLQELSEVYNDSIAQQILEDIDKEKEKSASKSSWEKELVNNIKKKTNILDEEGFTNLNHLYDHRNFSAHPALNSNFELIAPSKETVYAHIQNILKSILIKPSIFIKKVFDMMTEELMQKKDLLLKDPKYLNNLLVNKYFSHMSDSMLENTFIALWKISFFVTDDNCNLNRRINTHALMDLYDYFNIIGKKETLYHMIERESGKLNVSPDNQCIESLVYFLSEYPDLYEIMNEDSKKQSDHFIESNPEAKATAWHTFASIEDHLKWLEGQLIFNFNEVNINFIFEHYQTYGNKERLLDLFVEQYVSCHCYNNADLAYSKLIHPFLDHFCKKHFISIIEGTNGNNQLYGRWEARSANTEIMRAASDLLDDSFDPTQYPFFEYNKQDETADRQ